MPYQPMKEPQKEVSQADMLAILEKHAKKNNSGPNTVQPKTEAVVANPAPARVLANLEWNKPEPGATGVRTTCGRYSCSKVTINGKTTYEAWRLVPDHWFKQIAIGLESFEAVKQAVDEDFRRAQLKTGT